MFYSRIPIAVFRRKRLFDHYALFLVALVYSPQDSHAQEGVSLNVRFLDEAPKKWSELRVQARRLQGQVHIKEVVYGADGVVILEKNNEIESLIKQNQENALYQFRSSSRKLTRNEVLARNSKYSFHLKNNEDKGWLLASFEFTNSKTKDISSPRLVLPERLEKLVIAHLNVFELRLDSALLRNKSFKVTQAQRELMEGRDLVKITFENSNAFDKAKAVVRGGWMILDPNRYWCLQSYDVACEFGNGMGQIRGTIELKDRATDFPVLARMRINSLSPLKRRAETVYEFDFREQSPPPSEWEFSLSAFGFKEPQGIVWNKGSAFVWWFMGVGALCLLLGLLFYQRFRRKKLQ